MEEEKEYIESGILELYVLGQLNAQEQSEVLRMASNNSQLKREMESIEFALEQYGLQNAIEPTVSLKHEIFKRIGVAAVTPLPGAKIIPITTELKDKYQLKVRALRLALAACVALLVVSVAALYSAHTELAGARDQIASLSLDREKFSSTVNFMKQNNADLNKLVIMAEDPNWKIIKLAGQKNPVDNMIVYWHPKGKHVMVNNNKMALPVNDEAHQYQLWALVDGIPVDLGVFDVTRDSTQILVDMKAIGAAQAFAVTLEKRGGSQVPTMTQMMVMGAV